MKIHCKDTKKGPCKHLTMTWTDAGPTWVNVPGCGHPKKLIKIADFFIALPISKANMFSDCPYFTLIFRFRFWNFFKKIIWY